MNKKTFIFDRYRGDRKMAEGIRVEAETLKSAQMIAQEINNFAMDLEIRLGRQDARHQETLVLRVCRA